MRVERLDLDEWADALPADGFEPFHLPAALSAIDSHAAGDLRLFGGFKGQQPVGLLPLVVRERSLGTAVLSPPPGLAIPRLGPILMPTSPKRRKREKVNREFTERVLDRVGADLALDERLASAGVDDGLATRVGERVDDGLTLFRMLCGTAYGDPRPYLWDDLRVEPYFTYRLDLAETTADAVLKSFSKSLRREIRDARDLDVTVEREGIDGAQAVYEHTVARYDEQDEHLGLPWPYVRDLWRGLDDRARTYVARDGDGEYLSGITALYSNDAAYFWQGGARAVYEGTSVNSLVHWRIVEEILDDPPVDSVTEYDLMGANTERLCRYKAKFGADLVPYYLVESSGTTMAAAKRAYEFVQG
ncbi:GNAT family N-acetyltransferase [Halomicrococcus sp. NG-SE-24]|uniref:GNAT family N-acetyltransferase n=1 Tax=Halomicrococcus sp. NG-SE-24 TaxID=3436928 RepID=UPI003D9589E2